MYFFDSVLYAGVIHFPLSLQPQIVVFEWNHFLWYPVTRAFYLSIHALGFQGTTYEALQWFNSIVGALGVAFLFVILAKRTNGGWGGAWASVLAVTNVYWSRSTGGEPYLVAGFFVLCFVAVLMNYFKSPSLWKIGFLAVLSVLATYFHIANGVLLPFGVAMIAWRPGHHRRSGLLLFVATYVFLFSPYIYVHRLFEWEGLVLWWKWGSGVVNAVAPGTSHAGQFDFRLWSNLHKTFLTTLLAFVNPAGSKLSVVGGVALLVLAAWPKKFQKQKWRKLAPVGFLFVIYWLLFSIWQPGNLIYWATHALLLVLILGVSSYPGQRQISHVRYGCLWGLAALLTVQNAWSVIWPHKKGEAVLPLVVMCDVIRQNTPPDGLIIISGRKDSLLKPYIPYFAHRRRIALDLAAMQAFRQNKDPISLIQAGVNYEIHQGNAVYLTEDLLKAHEGFSDWRISSDRIEAIWRNCDLYEVVRFGPPVDNALYLLWPKGMPQEIAQRIINSLEESQLWHQLRKINSHKQTSIPV